MSEGFASMKLNSAVKVNSDTINLSCDSPEAKTHTHSLSKQCAHTQSPVVTLQLSQCKCGGWEHPSRQQDPGRGTEGPSTERQEEILQSPFLPVEIMLWLLRLPHLSTAEGWEEENTGSFRIKEGRIHWWTLLPWGQHLYLESSTPTHSAARKKVLSLPPLNGRQCWEQCWTKRSLAGPNCLDPVWSDEQSKRLLHGSIGIDSFSFHILDLGWIDMLHGLHLKQAS